MTQDEEDREYLAHLAVLARTPAFDWFIARAVRPDWEQAERDLHDLKKSKDEREVALHVATSLKKVLDWYADQWERRQNSANSEK